MKVLGYGWVKSGDTLKKALEDYGVNNISKEGQEGKVLLESITDVKKDVKQSYAKKHVRKSAKPRFFRVILEEIET